VGSKVESRSFSTRWPNMGTSQNSVKAKCAEFLFHALR
jgi:hypothetical protein